MLFSFLLLRIIIFLLSWSYPACMSVVANHQLPSHPHCFRPWSHLVKGNYLTIFIYVIFVAGVSVHSCMAVDFQFYFLNETPRSVHP